MGRMKSIIDMGYAVIVEASLDEFAVLFPKTELNCCEIMKPLYIAFWDIIFAESVVPQNQSLILLYFGAGATLFPQPGLPSTKRSLSNCSVLYKLCYACTFRNIVTHCVLWSPLECCSPLLALVD